MTLPAWWPSEKPFLVGDVLEQLRKLPDESVQCVVTSPPYWGLRDYGTAKWEGGNAGCDHEPNKESPTSTLGGGKATQGSAKFYKNICAKCGAKRIDNQLGLEPTPEEYVADMVKVFAEVKRVLREDGTCWLNLGDSYLPDKNEADIPFETARALKLDGWIKRSTIIWHKPNPMPESVTDRPTKSHEYIFLLTKSARYYYDNEAVKEESVYPNDDRKARSSISDKRMPTDMIAGVRPGSATYPTRNCRSVWTITTKPFKGAHFATFPPEIPTRCIKAGTSEKGACPKCGAAWERVVETERTERTERTDNPNVGGLKRCPEQIYKHKSVGWQPGCSCGLTETTPCAVLDIFAGSGTTMVCAEQLGRIGLGIDLNPNIAEHYRNRLAGRDVSDVASLESFGAEGARA